MAALTLGGIYVYKPVLVIIKNQRGRSLLKDAQIHLQNKRWKQAGDSLILAVRFMPNHPEALRALVQFLETTQANPVLLRDSILKLKEQGHTLPADAILLSRTLLNMGELQGALTIFGELSETDRESAAGVALEKELLIVQGRYDPSEYRLNPEVKSVINDLTNGFDEVKRYALTKLWKIAEGKDSSALQALNYLSGLDTLSSHDAETLIKRVEAHPMCKASDRLGAYLALIRIVPEKKKDILKGLIIDYRSADRNDFRIFLQWLAFQGEANLLRSLVSTDSLYQDASLFTPYAESLAKADRWQDLLSLFDDTKKSPPVSPERIEIWRAEAWSHLSSDLDKVASHLTRAIDHATKSQNQQALLLIAKKAQSYGLFEIAIRGLTSLADSNPKVALPLLQMALEAADQKADSEQAYQIIVKLAQMHPKNQEYQARLLYLRLLVGDKIETIQIPESNQLKIETRSLLLALTAYRLGNFLAMKTYLAAIKSENVFSNGQKASYAGMLVAAGDLTKAFQIAELIPLSLLLKEEKALLKTAL